MKSEPQKVEDLHCPHCTFEFSFKVLLCSQPIECDRCGALIWYGAEPYDPNMVR